MATERLPMRQIREILRLKWLAGRSHRETARSVSASLGAVASVVTRATAKGLTWESLQAITDDRLERLLYGPAPGDAAGARPEPDLLTIHQELHKDGVTLELLHLEYLAANPTGYRYSAFCRRYRAWQAKRRLSMRQVHKAGEKAFVDYSGKLPTIVNPETGEATPVELFVAVLGASNYTFAEATRTQQSADWIGSHTHAAEYFGGTPVAWVPDQLRTGVGRPCRYEPDVQRTYGEWARHYGTVILPARPAKPRDKAKAEAGVQVAQRWILARLRHETFFALDTLNARIRELLEDLNVRPMKGYGGLSRRDLFERFDRPVLRPLPAERFVYGAWVRARVNIDYHIDVERHYYSVPHPLVHEEVEARVTAATVEVFHRGSRVALHPHSRVPGHHTTNPAHMPKAHQAHLEWTPSRLVRWGQSLGPEVGAFVEELLASRPHPEQGYRSCLGLLRLEKTYGATRLNAACARARLVQARSYRHVESILKHGLDRQPLLLDPVAVRPPLLHDNIRGSQYYQEGESS